MIGKRKRDSADFKTKVALEALKGELTLSQLATKHGAHQTMIAAWRNWTIEGLSGVFSGKAKGAGRARSTSCTARSTSWWWSRIFWPKPSVVEP